MIDYIFLCKEKRKDERCNFIFERQYVFVDCKVNERNRRLRVTLKFCNDYKIKVCNYFTIQGGDTMISF